MAKKEKIKNGKTKKERQVLFLEGIRELGTIRHGCQLAGITRSAISSWREDPDFVEEYDAARKDFAERLEEVVVGIVLTPENVLRSPVLAITLLNANLPQKYRPTTGMVQEDTARELLNEWRKAGKATDKPSEQKEDLGDPVENQLTEILKRKGSDDTDTGEEGSR